MRRFHPIHQARRGQRGQAIVLAALLMLLVFVAVMLTFAIGHRTREKIKLQALADSGAYSSAVVTARTFNYFAWSNRVHAAHDVAILSVQAHISYISWQEGLMKNTHDALDWAAGEMAVAELACLDTGLCCEGVLDGKAANEAAKEFKGNNNTGNYDDLHQSTWHESDTYDQMLATAAKLHWGAIQMNELAQKTMLQQLKTELQGQKLSNSLAKVVDENISGPGAAGDWNTSKIDEVVTWGPGDDWNEIESATRNPAWLYKRSFKYSSLTWIAIVAQASEDLVQQDCFFVPPTGPVVTDNGNAKTLGEAPSSASDVADKDHNSGDDAQGWAGGSGSNKGAKGYAADDHGGVKVAVACMDPCAGYGQGSSEAGIWTTTQSSKHFFSHENKDDSIHNLSPAGDGDDIYVKHPRYKWGPEDSEDKIWFHPHIAALLTKAPMPSGNNKAVYDFRFKANAPLTHPVGFMTIGGQGDQDASSLMAALGGALVYYHKPQKSDDNWREPPSFWNPFWRAKLHPIIKEEADQALADHGASLTNYDGLGKPQFD